MLERVFNDPEVFRIKVPLPENPLKYLNSYVVKSRSESLIIDTGFNRPDCKKILLEELQELSVDLTTAKLVITHFHSDHSGLAADLGIPSDRIYMTETDKGYLERMFVDITDESSYWALTRKKFVSEGFPEDMLDILDTENPGRKFMLRERIRARAVNDGDEITVGDIALKVISTPGHTPGNCCLYYPEKRLLFSGDHVLFDISPNIESWVGVPDSLGDYLNSLDSISRYEVEVVFPGHREASVPFYERIKQLKEHHEQRLREILDLLCADPGMTGYMIASKMQWSMRGKAWDAFPIQQRWFAVNETISHLDFLRIRQWIDRTMVDNRWQYVINKASFSKDSRVIDN